MKSQQPNPAAALLRADLRTILSEIAVIGGIKLIKANVYPL